MYTKKQLALFLDFFTLNKKRAFTLSALITGGIAAIAIRLHSPLISFVIFACFSILMYIMFNLSFNFLRERLWEASPRIIDLQKALTEAGANISFVNGDMNILDYKLEFANESKCLPVLITVDSRTLAVVAITYHVDDSSSSEDDETKTITLIITDANERCFARTNGIGKRNVYIDVSMAERIMMFLKKDVWAYESGLGTTSFNLVYRN